MIQVPDPNNYPNGSDDYFMALALLEARKGLGRTAPNPCVGAVITKNGKILSKGYHKKAGTPHAEINALQSCPESVVGATMYVTLEPCNHTGRTPPCSHAIVKSGIKRVIVGITDPNPLVSGSGACYLRENGVEVRSGVLERDCCEINLPFLKHIKTSLPFVIMKAGISLDGRLSYQQSVPGKITGKESRKKLHQLRDAVDAILIGSGTLVADDPTLTTRIDQSGADPIRVVLDTSLKISLDAKILHLDSHAKTIVCCSNDADAKKKEQLMGLANVEVLLIAQENDGSLKLDLLLAELGSRGICSLLVEGGGRIHSSFLKKGLVDRVTLFMASIFAGSYGNALLADFYVEDQKSAPRLQNVIYQPCGEDLLVQGDFFTPGF